VFVQAPPGRRRVRAASFGIAPFEHQSGPSVSYDLAWDPEYTPDRPVAE
jgi:hypothetical protein